MADAMTRREFVKAGVVIGAGVALAATPGCSSASRARGEKAEIETPSASYGGDGEMGKRILVGYATRTGSTVGVAEAIAKTLGARGFEVDMKPLKERPSLDGYDAAIIGSAVNGGAWLPEAVKYVEAHAATLRAMPTAVFCVHIMNLGGDAKATRKRLAYIDPIRTLINPGDEAFFAGKGPTAEDTSLVMRWAFKAFGGGGEGDCRDWEKIRDWAQQARV